VTLAIEQDVVRLSRASSTKGSGGDTRVFRHFTFDICVSCFLSSKNVEVLWLILREETVYFKCSVWKSYSGALFSRLCKVVFVGSVAKYLSSKVPCFSSVEKEYIVLGTVLSLSLKEKYHYII
jgi:hypothetical protein